MLTWYQAPAGAMGSVTMCAVLPSIIVRPASLNGSDPAASVHHWLGSNIHAGSRAAAAPGSMFLAETSVIMQAAPTLGILLPHGWGMVLIPVHRVLIRQHNNVALSLPLLGTAHHDGQDQFFEVVIKLLVSTVIRQFMQ